MESQRSLRCIREFGGAEQNCEKGIEPGGILAGNSSGVLNNN